MTVRDILTRVPKFNRIEIFGFGLDTRKTTGYAVKLLKRNCDVLDEEVLFMEPGNEYIRILINARYEVV